MAFVTDLQVRQALADVLNVALASLPSKYTNISTDANAAAYGAILRELGKRGFTKTQADLWVDGAEYNRDIAVYWCLVKGHALDKFEQGEFAQWRLLDRRKELATAEILNSSYARIEPANSRVVGGGAIDTTNDLVRMDDDADPDIRRGEVTEW